MNLFALEDDIIPLKKLTSREIRSEFNPTGISINNKRVLFTGTVPGYAPGEYETLLIKNGADIYFSVSQYVDMLIIGESPDIYLQAEVYNAGIPTIHYTNLRILNV